MFRTYDTLVCDGQCFDRMNNDLELFAFYFKLYVFMHTDNFQKKISILRGLSEAEPPSFIKGTLTHFEPSFIFINIKGRGRRGKDALRPTVGTLRSVARRDAPYMVP